METSTHLKELFTDVPFHEIIGKDISQLNDKELEAFIQTTRAQRVAPSERKKAKVTAAKVLTGKKKNTTTHIEELSHLL